MENDNQDLLSQALFFNPTPDVDRESELLKKHVSKMDAGSFRDQLSTSLITQQSTDIAGIKSELQASDYAEIMGQTYMKEWEASYITNMDSLESIKADYQDRLDDIKKAKELGYKFDIGSGDYISLDYQGMNLPEVAYDGMNKGSAYLRDAGSEEAFLESYYSQSAAGSSGIFGRGSMSQIDMADNLMARGNVGKLISNYGGWEQENPIERFSDMALSESASGLYPSIEDAGTAVLDVGRYLTLGLIQKPKVLGVDSLFDSSMTKALELPDPVFQDWASSLVKRMPELAHIETENGLEGPQQGMPGLAPLVRKFGSERIIDLLSNAKNADAFIMGMNLMADEKRMEQYTNYNNITLGMQAKMLAHGFQTDPTMALDVGVGMGLAAAGTVTGMLPLTAIGGYLATARAGAKVNRIIQTSRRIARAIGVTDTGLAKSGIIVQNTGKVLVNVRRVLPSQVFSELVFPSMAYMRAAGKAKKARAAAEAAGETVDAAKGSWARGLIDHVTSDAQFVDKGMAHKAWIRFTQNGLEGGIQGFTDYFVMQANERAIIEATYGAEAAAQLETDKAGLAMMTGMGLVMGGVMGAGMGAVFEGVGKLNNGAVTKWLDNRFTKGFAGHMAKAAATWNNYKALSYKQTIIKKAKGNLVIDEAALDKATDTHLRAMEVEGLDVGYGIKQAMAEVEGDEMDVLAFVKNVRRHAKARAEAKATITGIPRSPDPDLMQSLAANYKLTATRAELAEIKASKATDHGTDSMESPEIDLPEALVQERADSDAEIAAATTRVNNAKSEVEAGKNLVRDEKGTTRGDRQVARGLNKDAVAKLKAAEQNMQEVMKRRRDINAKERTIINERQLNDFAGREMDYLKRLYHLKKSDIEARLAPGGKGRITGDVALDNIYTIIDGKTADDDVSTAAMRSLFTDEELNTVMIKHPDSGEEVTLGSLLNGSRIKAENAKGYVEKAREQLLKNAELMEISRLDVELEALGRSLGSDDEARSMIAQAEMLAKVRNERRNMSGEVETTGLDSAAREKILKTVDDESLSAKEKSESIYADIDKEKDAIVNKAVTTRSGNDPELLELEARKKKLAPSEDINLEKAIEKRKAEIRKGVESDWKTTRKNLHSQLMQQVDVMDRTGDAHVMPLIGIINRLRYEASKGQGVRMDEETGSVRFFLHRKQVLSMLPEEYRFLINTFDSAMQADGTFELEGLIGSLMRRVARADTDMRTLIEGGARNRAGMLRDSEGMDSIELTDSHMEALMEAQKVNARIEYQRTGEYAGGGNRDNWDAAFHKAFNARGAARLMKNPQHFREVAASYGVKVPEGELSLDQVKTAALEIYREAGALEEFADLGGGENARAYMPGDEAAYTIIESLESSNRADGAIDNAGRFDTVEGRRDVVESVRPDVERRLERRKKADPKSLKRIGNVSTMMTRRLFEQSRTNDRVSYLLFDENGNMRSDKDVEKIKLWLESLTDEDLGDGEMHGGASGSKSFRLAPPEHIAAATDKPAKSVDDWIDNVTKSLANNPPAMIATIHDAVYAALPGMFGALSPAFKGVGETGFASGQGAFGAGFGMRTLMARPGSLTDSMNTAFELSLGVQGWASRTRAEYGETLRPELEKLGLITSVEELTDEVLVGAIARGMAQDSTKKQVAELFFTAQDYLDADASGGNILMANMKYAEFRRALDSDDSLNKIMSDEIDNLGRKKAFDSGAEADLYKITRELTEDTLNDPRKVASIIAEVTGNDASDLDIEAWTSALAIWKDILSDPDLDDHLRNGLFKSPVMTDLYQQGVVSMTDDMVNKFFRGGELDADGQKALAAVLKRHDLSALRGNETGTSLQSSGSERALASKLAHLLHGSREQVEGSLIKDALFGEKFLTNEEIGRRILAVRKQQVAGVTRNPGDILNNPDEAHAAAMALMGLGSIEKFTANDHADLALGLMLVYRAAQESTAPNMRQGDPGATFIRQFDKAKKAATEAAAGIEDPTKRLEAARAKLTSLRQANTARSDAFHSMANQNFHLDEAKVDRVLSILVGDEAAKLMMKNRDPLAKQAMLNGFFRNLSTSNEGRFFVNSVLDMIADKSSRVNSQESPLGTAKFFGTDGTGMDPAKARRAAIMQLAINAAEMTGKMPELGSKSHVELDMTTHLAKWQELDALHDRALNGTAARLPSDAEFEAQLMDMIIASGLKPDEDTMKAAINDLKKLRKNALSGRTKVNDLGEEGAVTRMGPWGMMDPRLNYNSKDSVGLASAARVQMSPSMTPGLRELGELDAVGSGLPEGAVFSKAEMQSTIDAADMAIPVEPLEALEGAMTLGTDLGVGTVAALRYRSAVMKTVLDRFADDVKTDYARKLKESNQYDKLYVLFREARAIGEEYSYLESRTGSEVNDLVEYGAALFNGTEDPKAHRGHSIRHRARLIGRREVNKSAQWARDLQNAERSILSLEADPSTRMLMTEGDTWEDLMARTAQMNPNGEMMSWLFKAADSHGRVITHTGRVGYNDRYQSATTPLFAQMNDSQFLTATALTEAYSIKRVAMRLGLKGEMTAERYRQLRSSMERSMGAESINTDGFDADIAALFAPDRIDDTWAKAASARKEVELELESTDFVSDLGATGEGKMLFAEQFTDAAKKQIMAELKVAEKTFEEFVEQVFNKTITDLSGKPRPTAFINMYGEVINPHKIVGQARIALTADERVRALNLTKNRPLMDRMRTGAALGLHKTAFEAEVSARMSGYDGDFGAPLKAVKRQAAQDVEAIEFLMNTLDKKVSKKNVVTDLSSGRRYLDIDEYETDEMVAEAKKASATRTLRNFAPLVDSDLSRTYDALVKKMAKSPALQDAMLIAHIGGDLDRAGVYGILRLEYPDMPKAEYDVYVDSVMDARGELHSYLNERIAHSPEVMDANATAHSTAAAFDKATNLADQQRAAHDGVEEVILSNLPNGHTDLVLDKMHRNADPANHQDPAPSEQDFNADPENIDPRAIDDGRVHKKMLRLKSKPGEVYTKVDTMLGALENKGVLTSTERLLLDATFVDMAADELETMFTGMTYSTPDRIDTGAAGRAVTYMDVGLVVQRIELARDIHTKLNPDTPFGAAGVLLEEVGHLIEMKMRAQNPSMYGRTVKDYLNTYGTRMDPVLKEALGQVDSTVDVSEGFARSYAAVMMNRGAKRILGRMNKAEAQFFGEANMEGMKRMAALSDHAAFREFNQKAMGTVSKFLRQNSPLDVEASLRSRLTQEGRMSEAEAWEKYHNDDTPYSRELADQDREISKLHRTDDGRLDLVSLRKAYGDDPTTMHAIMSAEIESQLEIIGGGAEVTTEMGRAIMAKLDRLRAGLGRAALHNLRAAAAPASLLSKAFDAAYGVKGEMTTAMRGLFSIMSPTETMSMGGFSTLGGGRVPTLQGMMTEIKGRWDGPLETLYMLEQADLAVDKGVVKGTRKNISDLVFRSILEESDSALDVLAPNDRDMAIQIRTEIQDAMRLTADDMLEAGLLKSEKEAADWAKGVPLRLVKKAVIGEQSAKFQEALRSHVAEQMSASDNIDAKAIELMVDNEGKLIWDLETDGHAVDDAFLARLEQRGHAELANKVKVIKQKLEADGLAVNSRAVLRVLASDAAQGRLRKSGLGDLFIHQYNRSLTAEMTPEAAVRARVMNKDRKSTTTYKGYASLKAIEYNDRLGSSAYIVMNDPFLNPSKMREDPLLGEFIETDFSKIIQGVMRGPASDALDRAVYGKAFGVKGMGIEDILDMLEGSLDQRTGGKHYETINKITGEGTLTAKSLDNASVKLMKAQLSTMRMAVKYAKGTMSRSELDAQDTPFFAFLNDIMSAATIASVAPRYILGSLVEELPMAALKGYAEMFAGIRGAVDNAFTNTSKKDRAEVLRGITTFVRDLQHNAATESRYRGADAGQFVDEGEMEVRSIEALNQKMQKLSGIGFRELTQKIKTQDARASVARMLTMIAPGANGKSVFNALTQLSTYDLGRLRDTTEMNELFRAAGVHKSQFTNVREMIRMGVFDADTADTIKALFRDFADELSGNFDFVGAQTQASKLRDIEARQLHMQAIERIRAMIKIDSIRNAKESTLEMTALQGGNLQQIMTRLTSYSSMVSSSLRRLALGGGSMVTAQMLLYMASGYMYFKATQLARGKSFDEAVTRGWKENPEVELYDMIMSVPFLGYAQMPLAFLLKQAGLGSILGLDQFSVKGGKAYSLASVQMLNKQISLLSEAPKAIKSMFDESSKGRYSATDYASATPIAFSFVWAPIFGRLSEALLDSKTIEESGFSQAQVNRNPDAYVAWAIRNMSDPNGASIRLPEFDADGLLIPPADGGSAARAAQDQAALVAARAAGKAAQSRPEPKLPTPIAPQPAASDPVAPKPALSDALMFKAAPSSLK